MVEISFDLSNFEEDQVTAFEMLIKRLGGTVYGETNITQATVSVTDNDAGILSRLFVGEYNDRSEDSVVKSSRLRPDGVKEVDIGLPAHILMHSHGVGASTEEQPVDDEQYAMTDPIEILQAVAGAAKLSEDQYRKVWCTSNGLYAVEGDAQPNFVWYDGKQLHSVSLSKSTISEIQDMYNAAMLPDDNTPIEYWYALTGTDSTWDLFNIKGMMKSHFDYRRRELTDKLVAPLERKADEAIRTPIAQPERQSIFSNFFSGRKAAKTDLPNVSSGDIVVQKSTGELLLVQEVHSEGVRMLSANDGSCVYGTKDYSERFRPLAIGDVLRRPEVDDNYTVTDIDRKGPVTLHAGIANMEVAPPDLVMCYRTAAETSNANTSAIDDYLDKSGMTRDELYEKVKAYAPALEQLTLGRDGVLDKYFLIWKDTVGDK